MSRTLLALSLLLASPLLADDFYTDADAGSDANAGTDPNAPVQHLQVAVDRTVAGRGDRVFASGVFHESVTVSSNHLSLVANGLCRIEGQSFGLHLDGSDLLVRGLEFRSCGTGLSVGVLSSSIIEDCVFRENSSGFGQGVDGWSLSNVVLRRGTFLSHNSVAVVLRGDRVTLDRLTVHGGTGGVAILASNCVLRNSIVSSNSGYGVRLFAGYGPAAFEYLNVVGNGTNYQDCSAGPNDMSLPPGYVEPERANLGLRSDSAMLGAGRDVDGFPVSVGAHEKAILASASAAATAPFSDWVTDSGTSVASGAAEVRLQGDGMLRLNGVATAAARSPVIDLGARVELTSTSWKSLEDLSGESGSRRTVDADGSTLAREIQVRVGDASFGALDASPDWVPVRQGQELHLVGRHLQFRVVLTTEGR